MTLPVGSFDMVILGFRFGLIIIMAGKECGHGRYGSFVGFLGLHPRMITVDIECRFSLAIMLLNISV